MFPWYRSHYIFSSISLQRSLRNAFLPLLSILWNSPFRWVYLSFSKVRCLLLMPQINILLYHNQLKIYLILMIYTNITPILLYSIFPPFPHIVTNTRREHPINTFLSLLYLLCPMSQSPSEKREGLQDNATRKTGSLLLTQVRAPATSNALVWGQRAPSPSCYTNL